jgi:hypothetical protein
VARCVAASQVRYHLVSRATPLKRGSVGRQKVMRVPATAAIAFLMFISCRSSTSDGVLRVMVTEQRCEFPLPGVSVTATNGAAQHTGVTDAEGWLHLSVPAGTWTITPHLVGASTAETRTAVIRSGGETQAKLHLGFAVPGTILVQPHGPCRP